jgi:hypothetical protein
MALRSERAMDGMVCDQHTFMLVLVCYCGGSGSIALNVRS